MFCVQFYNDTLSVEPPEQCRGIYLAASIFHPLKTTLKELLQGQFRQHTHDTHKGLSCPKTALEFLEYCLVL